MRRSRLAIVTGAAAAAAGALWLKRARDADDRAEEDLVLDLESPNGASERWERAETEFSV